MAIKTDATAEAEEFIEKVKSMVRRQDDLIYGIDSGVLKPNSISPSTIGSRDAWIEVTLYNAVDAENALSSREWMMLGDMGASVNTYSGDHRNGYNPVLEIEKRVD